MNPRWLDICCLPSLVLGHTGGVSTRRKGCPSNCLLLMTVLSALVGLINEVRAAPETWLNPIQSIEGNAGSGFGSALACSDSVGPNPSYFAIGAPQENSGEGRVYIAGPSGIITTITPPGLGGTGNFGAAVTFVRDINGDSIDELVIGEPDSDGASGYVHMYLSTGVAADPYMFCGNRMQGVSFGAAIIQTSATIFGGVQIAVGAPLSSPPSVEAFNITDSMGSCTFGVAGDYVGSGAVGSRFGQCIGEIDTAQADRELLVGAPLEVSNAGRVYTLARVGGASVQYTGSTLAKFGVAVAAAPTSPFFAFHGPGSSSSDTVYVKGVNPFSFLDLCSLPIPMSDLPDTAAQSLIHLLSAFNSFVPGTGFATYRDESSTGGSVAFFAVDPFTGCSTPKQINNCIADAGQKQGQALAGGLTCKTTDGKNLLLVGAPGFSGNKGRVDIYAEGSHLSEVAPCGATNTPTPTPTPTPTIESSPIVDPTTTPAVVTPIPVDPGTRGLPAPTIRLTGSKSVVISAAPLAAKNKNFPFLGWLFTITSRASKSQAQHALMVDALRVTSKKEQLFARRNMISRRNLKPGTYTVTYQPVFRRSKDKNARVLGKSSLPAKFVVR